MRTDLSPSTRVAWKSGKQWKTGTILLVGKPDHNPKEQLKKEFTLAYDSRRQPKSEYYYVAADSPLFQPGYTVHCVPANHLQHEKTSWPFKERLIEKMNKKELLILARSAIATQHRMKKRCPQEILIGLHQIHPDLFPKPTPSLDPTPNSK